MQWRDAAQVWAGEKDTVRGSIPAWEAADAKQFWCTAIGIEGFFIYLKHISKRRVSKIKYTSAGVFSDSEKYYKALKLLPLRPSSVTLLDVQKAFMPLDSLKTEGDMG